MNAYLEQRILLKYEIRLYSVKKTTEHVYNVRYYKTTEHVYNVRYYKTTEHVYNARYYKTT
jgi:hypothetical protein